MKRFLVVMLTVFMVLGLAGSALAGLPLSITSSSLVTCSGVQTEGIRFCFLALMAGMPIVTESTMIGHDPGTPAGAGIGVGTSMLVTDLVDKTRDYIDTDVIAVIPGSIGFEKAAAIINQAVAAGVRMRGDLKLT